MNVLVWFKRDLRIHDHPALVLAAGIGAVLPVFVVEPELWAQPEASARQWGFVAESLADLREDLAGIGAPLVVRVGDAVQVLAGLCRRHAIGQIVSHAETGAAWTDARDRRVADWARGAGTTWIELPPTGVVQGQPGTPLPAPALLGVPGAEPGLIPPARAMQLATDPCPHRQLGGRKRGLELLDSFLWHRGEAYSMAQSCPVASERASSRLSPHLAWGTLAVGEVASATVMRRTARPGGRWGSALSAFLAQLAGREACAAGSLDVPAGCLVGPPGDPERLAAWVKGETGLPFLDASLRYLRATGWLNARMRGMVAAVACHQLGLDEEAVGQHLARLCTDHDPHLHGPLMQALARSRGSRRAGFFDPVKLGGSLDAMGSFTRRWVPELAAVPDIFLHAPWRWPEARRLLGHRYPEPVVDLASAAREARERSRMRWRADSPVKRARGVARSDQETAKPRPGKPQAQLCLPF